MSYRIIPQDRLVYLRDFERGLTSDEVMERYAKHGHNDIVESARHPWWGIVRDTAKDPMLWFFGGTSALYALVGQHTEAITLFAAILPLMGMDVYLHRRTQASTEGLKSRLATEATVFRNGLEDTIDSRDLVPGDLVRVQSGDPLPADGIFAAAAEVQVDESALTGEAYPVSKRPLQNATAWDKELRVDDVHWAFAGTRMLTGNAHIRIVFTGPETLYGEIVQSAVHGAHDGTPLQRAIGRLVRVLLFAAIGVCLLLAGIRLYQGHSWLDALISAVTLATAAIPEEFPVVFTFFLGVGVYRLAKHQALVRRAVTVENIGRVTCICSDKTGTITEGQLQLTHLLPALSDDENKLLTAACLASRSDSGDPMDDAIFLRANQSAGLVHIPERIATFPFTEDRKRETAVSRLNSSELLAASKGAAEVILRMCCLKEDVSDKWIAKIQELASGAHKVIAVASRSLEMTRVSQEPDSDFDFVGLLAFEDPVRPGVRDAVKACQAADIHAIMVTGDHPLTARAVAIEVGLGTPSPRVMSGDEVEEIVRKGGGSELRTLDVIARAKPAQKLLLVKALQEAGDIVAVTGDGVNDVPALQAADIGVAMGERGTRSAREVASIVLLDDNFKTIVGAIAEGRQLFKNLQLSFQYLLIIHIPLVLTATVIPMAGYPLLYLPVHVVWLEMVIHPTAMLVFQESAPKRLIRDTRKGGRGKFFTRSQWMMILVTGFIIAAFVSAGYLRSLEGVGNVEHGRAMALATFTTASALVTAALSRLRTRAAWAMCLGTVVLSFMLIQAPIVDELLHLTPLHWDDWALAFLAGSFAAAIPAAFGTWSYRRRSSTPA